MSDKNDRELLGSEVSLPVYEHKKTTKSGVSTHVYLCMQICTEESKLGSSPSCTFVASHFADLLMHLEMEHNWKPQKRHRDYCCGAMFTSKLAVSFFWQFFLPIHMVHSVMFSFFHYPRQWCTTLIIVWPLLTRRLFSTMIDYQLQFLELLNVSSVKKIYLLNILMNLLKASMSQHFLLTLNTLNNTCNLHV